jgi:hypothetical protein
MMTSTTSTTNDDGRLCADHCDGQVKNEAGHTPLYNASRGADPDVANTLLEFCKEAETFECAPPQGAEDDADSENVDDDAAAAGAAAD